MRDYRSARSNSKPKITRKRKPVNYGKDPSVLTETVLESIDVILHACHNRGISAHEAKQEILKLLNIKNL